jgi:hypothetical protein
MTAEAAGSVLGSRSRPRHTIAHLLAGLPFEKDQQRGPRQVRQLFVSGLLAPMQSTNEPRPVPNLSATISGLLVEHPRGELAGLIV